MDQDKKKELMDMLVFAVLALASVGLFLFAFWAMFYFTERENPCLDAPDAPMEEIHYRATCK